jgi:LysR family transcriptional regulator, glycine cleavage system transcriptional activator
MEQLNRFHLNGLRALDVVGRVGTLAKAAEEMAITPGAVSQQVIKTESQLGKRVFIRTPSGLTPTPFGRRLLKHLELGFREIEKGLAAISGDDRRVLQITSTPAFASKWLVPRLGDFSEKHPGINVQIESSLNLVDLDLHDIDVAIRFGSGAWVGCHADLLVKQQTFPVCSPSYAKRLKSPRDLLKAQIIRYTDSIEQWSDWLALHGIKGEKLPEGIAFSESSMCIDATIAGLGVMLGWQVPTHDALCDGRLVRPFDDEFSTDLGLWFVTSAARRSHRRITIFKKWLNEEMVKAFGLPKGERP